MAGFADSMFSAYALIGIAALAAGFVNAIAGGGTFFSFPAFVAAGVPPALASASNNVGLWPGNGMAAFAYRRELWAVRAHLPFLSIVTLAGSTAGAGLLHWIGNEGFARVLPLLVVFATALFAYAEQIRGWVLGFAQRQGTSGEPRAGGSLASALGLGVVAVYGGFFGGGVNLMVLASLSLMGYRDIQQTNAIKNYLAVLIIASVFAVFIVQGGIAWGQTLVCAVGAMTGGFVGASVAKKMPVGWLRGMVIFVGIALTIIYTWQYWLKPAMA